MRGLCRLAQQGNYLAANILLNENSSLIYKIAAELFIQQKSLNQRMGLCINDLHQAGCEAVWHCIDYYDPTRGAKFSTFAADCARNKLIDYLRKQKIVEQITPEMEQDRLTCYVGGIPVDDPGNDPLNVIM